MKISKRKNINRGYMKLQVWNEAIELNNFVHAKIKEINSISYKIKAQIEDSIFSVASNIAEGYSRRSLKEYIQFINISLGSLAENLTQITILLNSGEISNEWFEVYDRKHYSLENKLIKLNQSLIQKLKSDENWNTDYIIREEIMEYKSNSKDTPEQSSNNPNIQSSNHPTSQSSFYVNDHAVVDDNVEIGEGTKIWHFTHVQSGAKIGKKCVLGQNVNVGNNVTIGNFVKIQNNVSVYEGVTLEDYVFCGPSMVFTNILDPRSKYPQVGSQYYIKTLVKEGASLGANSTIVCGHTIGKYALVGAGAVVTKDVPDYALVVGNPARIIGWVSEAGKRLEFDENGYAFCEKSGRKYYFDGEKVTDVTEEK